MSVNNKWQFNELTPAQHERLAVLAEEMGEAIQAIGKILRHGYESHNPDEIVPEDERPATNRENLEKELGDVVFAINMLGNDISHRAVGSRVLVKAEKIKRYLHHQK
jgi:NTP pyrophosphatase (non-canonical NTP hydrolase)